MSQNYTILFDLETLNIVYPILVSTTTFIFGYWKRREILKEVKDIKTKLDQKR